LLPQKIISLGDDDAGQSFIEFIKDECNPAGMRRPLDAVKTFFEKHKDRRAAKKLLLESEKILAETEEQLSQSTTILAATEEAIQTISVEIGGLEAKIKALNDELHATKTKQEAFNLQRTKEMGVVEDGKNQVGEAQVDVAKAKANLDDKSKEERSQLLKDHPGPEKKMTKIEVVESDASEATIVHALGDLHGWAPGLINYLTAHGLAKIEISGIKVYKLSSKGAMSVDHKAMGLLFPDLKEYLTSQQGTDNEQKVIEWPHAGILGQPGQEVNVESHHTAISAEWTGKNEMFVQVGDVFDRADHSELAAEILRQLVIQAPAHVHILVGNHEEFLLLNDKETWLLNERKWTYEGGKGGNTRMLPMLYDETPEEALLDITWERYKSAAATLYLTQYFAKEPIDTSLSGPLSFLNQEEHKNFKERILAGTWEGYSAALELHERILETASASTITYPGAIAGLGVGDTWFMHAEPNGLKAFIESSDEADLNALRNPRTIGGRDFLVLEMDLALEERKGRFRSNCTELFWARDASSGFEGLSSRFSSQTAPVLRVMPGVRNIVHGHSPVPLNSGENKPHTYLARTVTQPVSPTTGSIRVYNIDEGMTPVYGVFESNQEKMKYTPVGLRVPEQLLEHHKSGDLIDEKDLWTLNESYLELMHPAYTTTPQLTLSEVPEQYKVKGPGQINLGELTQDASAVEHTSAEDFRKDPTQFSWLKMEQPENITNPLEGSTPPPDGRYRVQHETYMTMTLSEHLLKMLELDAEPPTGERPFGSHTTAHYLSGLRTEFKKPDPEFVKWGAIRDAYHTGSMFLNLRSTETGTVLNVRGINMTDLPVKIQLYNHLGSSGDPAPSTSTSETEILLHPGACILVTFNLIKPESFVDVTIDLGDGNQPIATDIVFGSSDIIARGGPEWTRIRFLGQMYKDYQVSGKFNEEKLPVLLLHTHQKEMDEAKKMIVNQKEQIVENVLDKATVRERSPKGETPTSREKNSASQQTGQGTLPTPKEDEPSSPPNPNTSSRGQVTTGHETSEPASQAMDHNTNSPGDQDITTAQARENEMKKKELMDIVEVAKNLREGLTGPIPENPGDEDNN